MTAYEMTCLDISIDASADLSSYQYYGVTVGSGGQLEVGSSAGQKMLGVLQDKPAAAGRSSSVRVLGVSRALAGGAITAWAPITVNASGEFVVADEEDEAVIGRALEACSDTEYFPLLLTHEGSAAAYQDVDAFVAAGNYASTGQYRAVKAHTTAGQVVLISSAQDNILGVLQNAPAASATALVKSRGVCTAQAGTGGVAAGDLLAVENDGQFITATTGKAIGFALAAIAEGANGLIFLMPQWLLDMTGQSLASGKIFLGSAGNLAAAITPTGDVTIDNTGVTTIGAKKVTVAMLYAAARGVIIRGDAANAASELSLADGKIAVGDGTDVVALSAKTSGQILVGTGTTLASVAVSDDATLAANGALTIGAKKIAASKMYAAAQGTVFRGEAANAVGELDISDGKIAAGDGTDVVAVAAKTSGQILIGTGTTIASQAVSGDATLTAAGALQLDKSFIRALTTDFLAADVIAGNATPLVLVDFSDLVAAGEVAAGDALIFHGLVADIYGGAANYDQNENSIIKYQTAGGGATISLTLANWFNGAGDGSMTTVKPLATDIVPDADEDIVWTMSASPKNVQGDRNLRVTCYYSVFTPHA